MRDDDVIDVEYEEVRDEPFFMPGGGRAVSQIVFWTLLVVALKVWMT